MRAHRTHWMAIVLAALLPVAALAQESAPPLPQDPRAPRFAEIERGPYVGFEVGYLMLFKVKVADPARYPFAPRPPADGGNASGFLVGTNVGYDLTRRLALSAFVVGGNAEASLNYGAFSMLAFGGDVRLGLIGSRDANDLERFYVYLHGRGGYLVTSPQGLLGTNDLYLAGGPGIEYYTHLRHFSIGLAADFAYLPSAKVPGVAITPTVRYTF